MGQVPRRSLSVLGSSTDLLEEVAPSSGTLDTSGLLPPGSEMSGTPGSTHRASPRLSSPLRSCSPQPAAAEKPPHFPDILCETCVRPGPPVRTTPLHLPPGQGREGAGSADGGSCCSLRPLSTPTRMPTAASQAPTLPWETQSPRGTKQGPGQQLSNQTKPQLKGHPTEAGHR